MWAWPLSGCSEEKSGEAAEKAPFIPHPPREKWFSAFGVDAQDLLRPSDQEAQCPRGVGGDLSVRCFPWRRVVDSLKKWTEPRECLKRVRDELQTLLDLSDWKRLALSTGQLSSAQGGVSNGLRALGDLAGYNSRK